MSWPDRLRRRHDRSARIQQTRPRVISPGSFTAGAGGSFLRRDDEWLGRDAIIRSADSGCRSLEDHRLHQSVAVEPDEAGTTMIRASVYSLSFWETAGVRVYSNGKRNIFIFLFARK